MLVEFSGRSRPSDKGRGGSHPDPEIRGGRGQSQKKIFLKMGSPGPLGPSPGLTLADVLYTVINLLFFLL